VSDVTRWLSARPRAAAAGLIVASLAFGGATLWRRNAPDPALTAPVRRGTLSARLTVSGTLKPVQSITYRSSLGSREAEIVSLAPEGMRVNEGDLLVRLDATELRRELERAVQEQRQARVDLQVAEMDRAEGQAAIDSLAEGEGSLSIDEAKTRLELAQKKVNRLKEEFEQLRPLLEKGFITREELRRTEDDLEQSEKDLMLLKRKADVLIEQTHPRDRQRAAFLLAQKESQRENARAKVQEADARVRLLQEQIEHSSMFARRAGLVVYEEYLNANPRRKIRVGDRVTASQGLITIPEVNRMLVEASASEADVHRVHPGQAAAVRLEAFPDLRLTGKVTRVGTLARASADRPFEEKRFDLIIELDQANAELRPEMTARADIALGDRPGVLLVPTNAVFERQGVTVCHVAGRGGVDTRQVQLGESSDVDVEVLSGLNEGERVTITDAAGPARPGGTTAAPAAGFKGGFSVPSSGTLSPR
jgi:HlyD family secretion protein